MSTEFLITCLILVLIPGTGVIYTVSIGLIQGSKASVFAALGCTIGIIPSLIASMLGLAAIMHTSALLFQILKYVGVAYLLYLAYGMWRQTGGLKVDKAVKKMTMINIMIKAVLINALNPKLSIFFLAFLPQFIAVDSAVPMLDFAILSSVFMAMTLVIFIIYGLFATSMRHHIINSQKAMKYTQRSFAAVFAGLAGKLALTDS